MNTKQKRSKNGCETCRRRKVKCDEIRPHCTECSRLRYSCRWSQGKRQPIKTARRGFGPVKSRDSSWKPRPIVPGPSNMSFAEMNHTMDTFASPTSSPDWGDIVFSNGGSRSNDVYDDFDESSEALAFLTISDHSLRYGDSQGISPCHEFPDLQQLFPNHQSNTYSMVDFSFEMFPSISLSDYHMTLPNSLTLTTFEHEALRHYQTTYSLYRTTKDPNWSTHKVLLHMGSQNTMIMHLLLSVSLNDYSIRRGNASSSQDAEKHFQTGAQLLIDATTNTAASDDVIMMAAYFFIYLYMSKRKFTAPQRLSRLSSTVLDFVKNQNLISSCITPAVNSAQTDVTSIISSGNRSLLARLIMWTLDEDVKCSFQGSGGHFARYLAIRDQRTKEIYDASRNALGDHWGLDYPHTQVLDDDQNSTVLEFLWAMMPLWQDINDLSDDLSSAELKLRIEQKFSLLEEKYSSVFRHSSEITSAPRPRILVNADYDIVLFNALRVYYYRSTLSDLGAKTDEEIEMALKTILTIIERTFASRGTELHDRLQWPLFLAGIETSDTIYRAWIFSRLTSERVATALRQTLDAQAFAGQRLKMTEIREMLYNGEIPSSIQVNNDNLSGVLAF